MPLYREDLIGELELDLQSYRTKGDRESFERTRNHLLLHGLNPMAWDDPVDPRIAEITPQRARLGFAS